MPDAGAAGQTLWLRRTHGAAQCGPVYFRFNPPNPRERFP